MMDADREWMDTREAALLWNSVLGIADGGAILNSMSHEKMRRLCREGTLEGFGVEVVRLGRQFAIRRRSLLWFLWEAAQRVSRRAEEGVGIGQGRVYELIGDVGEQHHGNGKAMDEYWRGLMREEFKEAGKE